MTLIPRRAPFPVLFAAVLMLVGGCAAPQVVSYHGRSFVPVGEFRGPGGEAEEPTVVVSDTVDTQAGMLYEQGYQLVGYSKFVSPLAPMLANANAKATARARGADYVLASRPRPTALGQHAYLATYWRSPQAESFILGAYYDDPPAAILAIIGCRANFVALTGIVPGTPADRAGLQEGDVVRAAAGERISSAAQLDTLIVGRANERIRVTVLRDGDVLELDVRLNPDRRRPSDARMAPSVTGIDFEALAFDGADRARFGVKKGLYVSGITPGSAGCTADLRSGDLITALNRETFKLAEQFHSLVQQGRPFDVELIRRGQPMSLRIDPGTAPTPRARIPEASHDFPWRESSGKDWSAMAAAISAGRAVLGAMQSYTAATAAQGEAQKAAHFRVAQQMAASRPRVEARRGRYFALTEGGHYVQISGATAAELANRPDARVQEDRRGRGYLTDSLGNRIVVQEPKRPAGPATAVRPAMPDQDAAFHDVLVEGAIIHAETMAQLNRWWARKVKDVAFAGL